METAERIPLDLKDVSRVMVESAEMPIDSAVFFSFPARADKEKSEKLRQ